MLVPLATSTCPVPLRNFYSAIFLYHDRPHLINRKLCGATTLYHYQINYNSSSNPLTDVINYRSLCYETGKLKSFTRDTLSCLVADLLLPYDKNVAIEEVTGEKFKETSNRGIFVTVRLLFPSYSQSVNTIELVVVNKVENYVYFVCASTKVTFTLVAPPFGYKFVVQNTGILQLIVDMQDVECPSGEWLADKLFPKMLKWIEDYDADLVTQESLSLISVEMYVATYKTLKDKYGKKMVDIWPENTDPLKFVYEDVAIATYLICLWSKTGTIKDSKPSFVDLGCGNGLLVYILSQEGYPGCGIDVRKRRIWDLYPSTTNLQVKTIIPSDNTLFPNTDWIIGNHSDELTPWIPVIAARSKSNFFLLPCCCFNFNATKYIRKNTAVSQYAEYMQYVESICNTCGFTTSIDKLRIPSTKRTCLVGLGNYNRIDFNQINVEIDCMINKNGSTVTGNTTDWIKDYQPRESKEKVRNCTQLDRDFLMRIIKKLTETLLSTQQNILLDRYDGSVWNAGGCLAIGDLVKTLEPEELKQLKSECGGLQTLMKNHRYIFDVAKGRVKLRLPYLRSDTVKYVEKPCWFLKNHPSGCLHSDVICAYSHL